MKKLLVLALASVMALSAFTACSKDEANNGGEEGGEASVVTVSIVDNTAEDGTVADGITVPYTEGMTVLDATFEALTSADISYALTEDEAHFANIDGKEDFYFGETEDAKYWHYILNGEDLISEEGYEPAVKTVEAGDVIVWNFDICEE